MGVGGQRHTLTTSPLGKTWYPLGGPQGCSGQVWEPSSPPVFDLWTVQTFANHYTDYAIPAHICVQNISYTWLSCSGGETKVQWQVWITVSGKWIQHVYCSSNDVWCFNLENQTWNKQATTEVKPHSRYGQSQMSLDNRNILIMGNVLLTSWFLVV